MKSLIFTSKLGMMWSIYQTMTTVTSNNYNVNKTMHCIRQLQNMHWKRKLRNWNNNKIKLWSNCAIGRYSRKLLYCRVCRSLHQNNRASHLASNQAKFRLFSMSVTVTVTVIVIKLQMAKNK